MRHHTKDKGDAGLGFVISSLLSRGVQIALPISEHLPFDCIAISTSGQMKRLSVKYRAAKDGVIEIGKRSTWADRHGSHVRHHEVGDYDAFAIYCPDTKECYFVRCGEFEKFLYLRVDEKPTALARRLETSSIRLDCFRVRSEIGYRTSFLKRRLLVRVQPDTLMEKDVKIVTADSKDPCHWCKAGFIYVADQALGTGRTVLCQEHGDKFIATFHEPEKPNTEDFGGV